MTNQKPIPVSKQRSIRPCLKIKNRVTSFYLFSSYTDNLSVCYCRRKTRVGDDTRRKTFYITITRCSVKGARGNSSIVGGKQFYQRYVHGHYFPEISYPENDCKYPKRSGEETISRACRPLWTIFNSAKNFCPSLHHNTGVNGAWGLSRPS